MNTIHCLKCGAMMNEPKNDMYQCSACGYEYYINPKPCNAVIIENNKGELLLVKRAVDPHKGWWDLPGGFTTIKETMEESVVRELNEELGISLATTDIHYFGSFYGRYTYKEDNYHTLCFIYSVPLDSTSLKAADDIEAYQWFPKNTIPFDAIAFPELVMILKDYLK